MLISLLFLALLLVPLALWVLRTRSARHDDSTLRTALLVFLMLLVAGFGLCGIAGAGFGLTMLASGDSWNNGFWPLFLIPGAIGLAVAWLIYWLTQKARQSGDGRGRSMGASNLARHPSTKNHQEMSDEEM